MPRPCQSDRRSTLYGFRRRRPLAPEQKRAPKVTHPRGPAPRGEAVLIRPKAVSTLRASVRFAAALCEISGDFLIFARLHTVGVSFSGRATKMQNWRVGPVQTVSGGSFWGSGFDLYDETGKPCVTFGYFSESYA